MAKAKVPLIKNYMNGIMLDIHFILQLLNVELILLVKISESNSLKVPQDIKKFL